MVVDCFRARPGEEYCNSCPSGSLSPKRELQGFATGLGAEHLAQATRLVLSDLFCCSGETCSPKRGRDKTCASLSATSRPGEGFWCLSD